MFKEDDGSTFDALGSWAMAAAASFLTFVLLLVLGDSTVMGAIFLAAIAFVVFGALFSSIFAKPLPALGTVTPGEDTSLRTPIPSDPAALSVTLKAAQEAAKAAGETPPTSAKDAVSPYAKGPKLTPTAPKVAAPAAPMPAPAAAAPAAPAAPAPAPAADGPGTKPTMLSAARDGGADDLKKIKGVGPKLETALNEMGVYHYDQIANWTADEVAWVDENLVQFKGRVSRDNWVAQAKDLLG